MQPRCREAQGSGSIAAGTHLYEATLLGPQALRDAYGSASLQYMAAVEALAAALEDVQHRLAGAHDEQCAHVHIPKSKPKTHEELCL